MVWAPKYIKKNIYLRIEHCGFNKVLNCELNAFFLDYIDPEIEPLKVCVSVGIGSHINIIMTVLDPCHNFQIAHGKTCIKRYVGFRLTHFIVEPVEYDVFPLLLNDFLISVLSHRLIDEGTVFYILDWLNFKLWSFHPFGKWVTFKLFWDRVRKTSVINRDLLFSFDEALLIFVFFNFIY